MIVATVRVGCGSYTSFWSLLANTCQWSLLLPGDIFLSIPSTETNADCQLLWLPLFSREVLSLILNWGVKWITDDGRLKMPFCGKMHRGRLGPQRLICSPLMWYHMPSSSGLIGWLLAWGSRYMKNFEIEGVSLWESKGLCVCFHGNNWCGRSQEFPVFLPTQLTRNNKNSKKQWSASILQPPSAMAVGLVSSTTKINK